MAQRSVELVCFDLGGVFVRLSQGWAGAVQRAGVDRPVANQAFWRDGVFEQLYHAFERGQMAESEYAQAVATLVGLEPDVVLAILDAILVEPYPGIDDLVNQLQHAPIQTACLSNTNVYHWRTMTNPGPRFLPLHRLHHQFASPFIGHRKPDAAIYQHVQNQTGVRPDAILFFDDAAENVDAAAAQGWRTHKIDPQGDPMAQVTRHLVDYDVL